MNGTRGLPSAAAAFPERRAAERAFDRASEEFSAHCVVHDEARRRLLERLDYVRLEPRVVADVGTATGLAARALAARYPAARVIALDPSREMLRVARRERRTAAALAFAAGRAEQLPLLDGSVDLLVANLCLPWCNPPAAFVEAARVLREGGLALFATVGPDTLQEVRRAWREADDAVHVHAFFDMHDLGDMAVAAGLADPVLDVDRIELTYGDVGRLVRDLRAWGAINTAAGRRRALTGTARFARFRRALASDHGTRFSVTIELVLGQAWGAPRRSRRGEHAVPADRIGRRRR
ncbi:MAG TPA: methyltransferase domain-containing protein [Gammaproteobacteria bacterium]